MMEESKNTLWCGNLSDQVTEELLYELFLQAGPLEKVKIARDRDGRQKNFAFITYCHEVSIPYAIELLRGTSLFNKALLLTYRGRMPFLPPPIRAYGPEPLITLQTHDKEQFANMAQSLNEDAMMPQDCFAARQTNGSNDQLVLASLQGNWSHRHHPYQHNNRTHDRHTNEFRSRHRPASPPKQPKKQNWSGRRHHRRGGYRD